MNAELPKLNVAVVGATGMVGRTMLAVLEARNFPIERLLPVASSRSVGSHVKFRGKDVTVMSIEDALAQNPHVALFSAGGDLSTTWAPQFSAAGITVVDNSSAWRMSEEHKLVVPEVNGGELTPMDLVVANPNCTTIQLVMCLKPLHDRWRITRGVVNTYQSVTGTGQAAVAQMEAERRGEKGQGVYPHSIDQNCLPHCDVFQENGYTREEMKVHQETKKIMGDSSIQLSCTAVRVPVMGGHSEAVYLELAEDFELEDVRESLNAFPGVVVEDEPSQAVYPMPLKAQGRDEVFVGRLRRDLAYPRGLHLWIVADNLRKGAATNTIQIAEYLHRAGRWS